MLRKVTGAITRPSNTTTYAAGEVLTATTPAAITFANVVGGSNGSGEIQKAILIDSANQATKGEFELWLFHTAPAMDADNALFTPTDAELLNLVGIIDFPTAIEGDATVGAGGNVVYFGVPFTGTLAPISTKTASRNLFGVVVVRNAYVPVSGEVFTFTLFVE